MDKIDFGHHLSKIRNLKMEFDVHKKKSDELMVQSKHQCNLAEACVIQMFKIIDEDFLEIREKL